MHLRVFTIALTAALLLSACRPGLPAVGPGDPLRVVATFSIVGDMVRVVGGEHIQLTTLVGPGQDSHTYSPSPADAAALAQAQLVFENGLEFETWLDDLFEASGSQAQRVAVTAGLDAIEAGGHDEHGDDDGHDDDGHEGEDEHGDAHGLYDPHAWHSVSAAIHMVRNIRDALAAADPANAVAYRANAAVFTTELEALNDWVYQQVETLPVSRRVLVTTHDTFGYFAREYGFQVLGTVLPASTEGASPSAQALAELVDAVRDAGVPAVFAENVSSNALINQVASEAGVTIIASLNTDALGPPGSDADTYVKMMRTNVTTIVTALSE